MQTETSTGVLYVREVPLHLKNHFRSICIKRGQSMKDVLIEFMRKVVKEDKK